MSQTPSITINIRASSVSLSVRFQTFVGEIALTSPFAAIIASTLLGRVFTRCYIRLHVCKQRSTIKKNSARMCPELFIRSGQTCRKLFWHRHVCGALCPNSGILCLSALRHLPGNAHCFNLSCKVRNGAEAAGEPNPGLSGLLRLLFPQSNLHSNWFPMGLEHEIWNWLYANCYCLCYLFSCNLVSWFCLESAYLKFLSLDTKITMQVSFEAL